MDKLLIDLERIAEDANFESVTHEGFGDLAEYYLGYSEGIYKSIELVNEYLKRRDV